MKHIFFLALTVSLLAACVPASVPVVNGTPVDPFVAVGQAQATAEAAQREAAMYGGQLTATAQAPIVAITSTAAAFEMQVMFAQATAQSVSATETVAVTQTAAAWTPTPNATMTAVFYQSHVEATQAANVARLDNLKVERAQFTNHIKAFSGWTFGVVMLVIGVMFAITWAKRFAIIATPIDPHTGKPQPMVNVIDGSVVDIDRAPNGYIRADKAYLKHLPAITAERQDTVTNRAQLVDMKSRTKVTSAALEKLMKSQGVLPAAADAPMLGAGEQAEGLFDASFPLPAWEIAKGWDGKGGLPYGISSKGLGLADLTKTPHIAAFGETGSGKSRRFLRPFITFALAAGHRVVILGKQVDFLPFASHPNAFIVPVRELTMDGEALKYAMFLKALVDEMGKRDAYLSAAHKSTWAQAGRETTLVVLDEYTNAMDLMPRQHSEAARRFAKGLIREGRKFGFSLLIAAQRAVGLRDEVTNLGRAVFHVADQQESRFAAGLPGAESLQEGYFLAKFGQMTLAGAFEPTDAEIASFLGDRLVPPLEPAPWLDLPALTVQPTKPMLESDEGQEAQIRAHLAQGLSLTAVVEAVWGSAGGAKFYERSSIVKRIQQEVKGSAG